MVTDVERIERAGSDAERRAAFLAAITHTSLDAVGELSKLRAAFRAGTRRALPAVPCSDLDLPAAEQDSPRRTTVWQYLAYGLVVVAVVRMIRFAMGG